MTTSMLPYPQTKLRIVGTYRPSQAGDALPAGQPDTVEIELNDDAVPGDPAELRGFVAHLVGTLFRLPPAGIEPDVTVHGDIPQAGVAGAERTGAGAR